MNLTARSYAPRAGSLPARVIQFFAANLGEQMSSADIAVKFDTPAGTVSTLLKSALDAGFLAKQGFQWCAGEDIDLAPDFGKLAAIDRTVASAASRTVASAASHTGAHNPFGTASAVVKAVKARAAVRSALMPMPDFADLQIDDGVDIVSYYKKASRWEPLFAALVKPGQSAVIDAEWRKSIKVEATKRKRARQASYQIGLDAEGKTRILRTA